MFKPGDKKPSNSGRKKGVTNKDAKQIRAFLLDIVEGQQEKIALELEKLEGVQYINALSGMMRHCMPQLKSVELKGSDGESPMQIIIKKTYEKDK